jgi:protease-4
VLERKGADMADGSSGWEREVLEKLAFASLREQRLARRWGIFFKLLGFGLAIVVILASTGWLGRGDHPCLDRCTALVDVRGEIDHEGLASADNIVASLQEAMKNSHVKGVILRMNSPGGSPVQAGIIHDEIRRLRAKHPDTPVYVVVEELAASAAYYIAVAADRIYVDKASLIGSIGVLIDGFGFTEAMDKLGVERRLLTAGRNKGFLDPFSELSPSHREYAQKMIDEIHAQFVDVVRKGRGERLKESPDLFSGLVWNGQTGIELGLADAQGNVDFVAREVIKAEDVVDFSPKENVAERLAKRFGASFGQSLGSLVAGSRWSLR